MGMVGSDFSFASILRFISWKSFIHSLCPFLSFPLRPPRCFYSPLLSPIAHSQADSLCVPAEDAWNSRLTSPGHHAHRTRFLLLRPHPTRSLKCSPIGGTWVTCPPPTHSLGGRDGMLWLDPLGHKGNTPSLTASPKFGEWGSFVAAPKGKGSSPEKKQ